MSVDEMIEFLQGCAQVGQPEFSKIEAALRAGQEMADKSEVLTQLLQDESFAKGAEKRKIGAAIDRAQIEMVDAWVKHYNLMKGYEG